MNWRYGPLWHASASCLHALWLTVTHHREPSQQKAIPPVNERQPSGWRYTYRDEIAWTVERLLLAF
ncbi:hypothetical protein [Rhodopirellula baltica]